MTRPPKTSLLVEERALDLVRALFSPEQRMAETTAALRAAKELRDLIDLLTIDAVRQARKGFVTWADIGDALHVTKQAAHQQYGTLIEEVSPRPRR